MTSREFVLWKAYRLKKTNSFHPLYYYFAQLTAVVRQGQVEKPANVKLKDFLLKFTNGLDKVPESIETITKRSKAAWKQILGGFKPGKKRK